MLSPSAYEITFQAKFNASSDEHVNTGAYTNSKEEAKKSSKKKEKARSSFHHRPCAFCGGFCLHIFRHCNVSSTLSEGEEH